MGSTRIGSKEFVSRFRDGETTRAIREFSGGLRESGRVGLNRRLRAFE